MEEVKVAFNKDEYYSLLNNGVMAKGTPLALIEPDFELYRMIVEACSPTEALTKFDEKFSKVSDTVHDWTRRVVKIVDLSRCTEDNFTLNLGFMWFNVKHDCEGKYAVSMSIFE